MPTVRSCLVSFVDSEGIEHSIRVPAESLYEAAIEAMAAFRRGAFAEMTFGSATPLRIRVKAPEEEHTSSVGKVLSGRWRKKSERAGEEESVEGAAEEVRRRVQRLSSNGTFFEVHLIVDNYATHKHHKVRTWLTQRPRYRTPQHVQLLVVAQSGLTLVCVDHAACDSPWLIPQRQGTDREKIDPLVRHYNRSHKPSVWTATARFRPAY